LAHKATLKQAFIARIVARTAGTWLCQRMSTDAGHPTALMDCPYEIVDDAPTGSAPSIRSTLPFFLKLVMNYSNSIHLRLVSIKMGLAILT